ncbi:MAG: ATP-binding protein [Lachnospiraceae bacterium]|nr:ATP-binding protein [Lachnospiraceae bacterium]
MGLTNRQVDALKQLYDSRRYRSAYFRDSRKSEVYSKIPQIKDIDARIADESVRRATLAIGGDKAALDGLKEVIDSFSAQKTELLLSNGYPADYLDPKYECGLCNDTGYVGDDRCECYKRAMSELIYNDSNLSGVLSDENFETFDFSLFSDSPEDTDEILGKTPRSNMEKVVETAKNFIADFDHKFENLLIYGPTGVGKTFLCSCIAKELLDSSHTVGYYTAYKFFSLLEENKFGSGWTDNTDEDVPEGYFTDCDLLIIDDLGTELTNAFTTSALYAVINERALKKLSTVISTNLSLRDIDTRYTERIFSRFNKDYKFIKLIGRDIRCT